MHGRPRRSGHRHSRSFHLRLESLEERRLLACTQIVNNPGDDAGSTLRNAVNDAYDTPGADEICITVPTVTLDNGEVQVDGNGEDIIIRGMLGGGEADTPVVITKTAGGIPDRIFNVMDTSTAAALPKITFDGLVITGGADSVGGGILNSGDLTLENVTVDGNTAFTDGGGIATTILDGRSPLLTIRNSTVSGNASGEDGGGIWATAGSVTIFQSTISGNAADVGGIPGDGIGNGGGLFVMGGAVATLDRSTITGNAAESGSGVAGGSASLYSVSNTIVAGNTGSDISGMFASERFSFIGGDPMLGPLADNGGITLTHLPMTVSRVIDMADPMIPVADTDQRGFARVVGAAADIGSVESGSAPLMGDFNGDGSINCVDIDALTTEISAGTNAVAFDLTGDGLVNLADRDAWLSVGGEANLGSGKVYLLGDSNLNGVVDISDFNIWNTNKFTTNSQWCFGDFTADGVVDSSDFGVWNANKFTASMPVPGAFDEPSALPVRRTPR